ncbi:MAG: nitrite/sulfite reductase [Actinobacteria bacterium]|nr:nitrite/sulfite reductase [Actinomycetota bacterium]
MQAFNPADSHDAPGSAEAGPVRRARPASRPRKPRDEGQWALGSRTPLNPNEEFKAADGGLNVRQRIETVYARDGFGSIPEDDLRGRFRWWGLYTQRRPGIPGGKTASLPVEELDDEFFMLRIRSDGGALNSRQLRTIAGISAEFGRGLADVTDRQNIQLHWIDVRDMPEIWRRLDDVGLGTTEACGDTPRVVLGSPLAGVAADEIIDGTPVIEQIVRRFVGDPEFANLPRKFKSAVSGSPRQDVAHEINDLSLLGVVHPEHGAGFDVWVGGGLSTNPMLAQRLGAWVSADEAAEVYGAVIALFRDYGYRRLRAKARLKFLLRDWGVERFREVLEQEYLGRRLVDGPAPPAPESGERDHIGIHAQRDGAVYVGAATTVGRTDAATLAAVADLAEQYGRGRIRLTPWQNLVLLDIDPTSAEVVAERLGSLGLRTAPSPFRRSAMACTGIEFCKLAISETKGRAAALVDHLESALPDFAEPIAIHVNGCPNSCARFQIADIGLKGVLVDRDGEQMEGFQVHLGGSLGESAGFGRSPKGLRLSGSEIPDYVERVLRRFREAGDGRSFAQWAAETDEEDLR